MSDINILGNKLNVFAKNELHSYMMDVIKERKKSRVYNINVYAVNISLGNNNYRNILNDGERIFCDGFGIQIAANILGMKVPEKITYVDWVWDLAELCDLNKYKIFLLGSDELNIANTANRIKEKYPDLQLFYHHGYFNKETEENLSVINYINSVRPELLLVGFGMPLQEIWISNNWNKIEANIFLTSGGCFDVIGGKYPRCPALMQSLGLQWLFRFILEPKRLFKRYIIGNPVFLFKIVRQKFRLTN